MVPWLMSAALASPAPEVPAAEAAVPGIEIVLAETRPPKPGRAGTDVVRYERTRDIKFVEPLCTLPCRFTLPPGVHKIATRTSSGRGIATHRLKLKSGDEPVVLKAQRPKTWALASYAVLQLGAAVAFAASSSTAGSVCFLYEPGGALEDPFEYSRCRSEEAAERSQALTTAVAFQAASIPFLVFSIPTMSRARGRRAERIRTSVEP